ncbi:MAG TPA: DUF4133 domain-containing protein [Chryseosolibacter sp.]
MTTTVYKINKGVNKPIEFKGLKAQYIGYLGIGLVALLLLFSILYIAGVNMFACVAIILILGVLLFLFVYRVSNAYGQYGLMKKTARHMVPRRLICTSRRVFITLLKM